VFGLLFIVVIEQYFDKIQQYFDKTKIKILARKQSHVVLDMLDILDIKNI
jgi:hypothetical protein